MGLTHSRCFTEGPVNLPAVVRPVFMVDMFSVCSLYVLCASSPDGWTSLEVSLLCPQGQ